MSNRLSYQSTIDCSDIFTEEFQNLLVKLHDKFNAEVGEIRKERLANQEKQEKVSCLNSLKLLKPMVIGKYQIN